MNGIGLCDIPLIKKGEDATHKHEARAMANRFPNPGQSVLEKPFH